MQVSAEKLSFTLRAKYLDSLMRQETEFFEKQSVQELPAKISQLFTEFPNAIGEKFSQVLIFSGMMISGFVIAFI
jgi:ABC-type multidrug transport system fused ATPase/permease subunit